MNKVYHGFSHSSGVYKITNKDNGLVYFGQATQLGTRAQQHEKALLKNKHDNSHLQRAWNKYGSAAFEFEVIAVYPDKTERDAAEQALIDEHYGPGCYNISKNGTAPMLGRKHSAETCAAISAANKGRKLSPESCAAISAARTRKTGKKRKPISPEHRAAISAAMTGKKREPFTPEHLAAMSAAMTGKKHSAESRAAISAAHAKRRAEKINAPV